MDVGRAARAGCWGCSGTSRWRSSTSCTRLRPTRGGRLKAANVGLAVVLWCLADPVNTNQLGNDSERVINSLRGGDRVWRILAIKNLALAVMLLPLAMLVTVIHLSIMGRFHFLFHTLVFDLGAILLWMGVGSVVSVLLPFHRSNSASGCGRCARARVSLLRAGDRGAVRALVRDREGAAPSLAPDLGRPPARPAGAQLPRLRVRVPRDLPCVWVIGLWLAGAYERRFRPRLIRDLERDV